MGEWIIAAIIAFLGSGDVCLFQYYEPETGITDYYLDCDVIHALHYESPMQDFLDLDERVWIIRDWETN